jgi:hypothetical protein
MIVIEVESMHNVLRRGSMLLIQSQRGDMRSSPLIIILIVSVMLVSACGSSSSSGGTVTSSDVTVSIADEATGVNITNFDYTVTWPSGHAVDADTVTSTSYYIVPASVAAQVIRGNFSASNCDIENALPNIELDTSVDGGTSSSTLSVLDDLLLETTYYICLTSAIRFSDGAAFAGMTNSLTTYNH